MHRSFLRTTAAAVAISAVAGATVVGLNEPTAQKWVLFPPAALLVGIVMGLLSELGRRIGSVLKGQGEGQARQSINQMWRSVRVLAFLLFVEAVLILSLLGLAFGEFTLGLLLGIAAGTFAAAVLLFAFAYRRDEAERRGFRW